MKLIITIFLILIPIASHAYFNSTYIPPFDPAKPIVGNWSRTYSVNMKNGNMFRQMEIYSFSKHNTYSVYYYAEDRKRPFEKFYGHYADDKPLLILYGHKKGEVAPKNKVWKDCKVAGEQLTCLGYHDEGIPFRRWYSRPDKLDWPCCPGF